MKLNRRVRNKLIDKARKGFRGYPLATVAYYGPDNSRATKVAVGILTDDKGGPDELRRWYSEETDARLDVEITNQILAFIRDYKAVSVASVSKILGCPHEEGIDYPEGQVCPECPYLAGLNRWVGLLEE